MKAQLLGLLVLSLGLTAQAEDCINMSGNYKFNPKADCTEKSYISLTEDPYHWHTTWGNSTSLGTHNRNDYSIKLQQDVQEIEIVQNGCEDITLIYDGIIHNQGPGKVKVKHKITDKNKEENGYEFKAKEFSSGLFEGLGIPVGTYRYKSVLNLNQTENEKEIHIKTRTFVRTFHLYILPQFDKYPQLDCKLTKN